MTTRHTIVLAQINLLVGDIKGNTEKVLGCAQRAVSEHSPAIVAFPELTLTSYPPEDLLLRPSLGKHIASALDCLADANLDTRLAVGFPSSRNGKIYNSLAVIHQGEVQLVYDKQCLPNYQVFDESRYFAAGAGGSALLDIGGLQVAFVVCEDLWEESPARQAREAGAELLISVNASPYHLRKSQERLAMLSRRCRETVCPTVYVNLVGGQDELVFDGASMALDADGELCFLAPDFTEGLYPIEVSQPSPGQPCEIITRKVARHRSIEAEIYGALVLGVRDYVDKNGFDGVVLGLSGGIDSALTLAIASDALGKDRVHAVMMPSPYTSQLSLCAAATQAETLGISYRVIAIDETVAAFRQALAEEFAAGNTGVTAQNLQSRCRATLLMAISNERGLLVLTTGNKSEVAVGYATLYGDMAGGFDVLKDVYKTMVFRLARYRNQQPDAASREIIPRAVIERPPSAELAPGQVDEDVLPPYEVLDQIIELYVEHDLSGESIVAKGHNADVVRKVLRLVDHAEYKRRQSPIGVRLTKRGFGRDRRYPITNGWPIGD